MVQSALTAASHLSTQRCLHSHCACGLATRRLAQLVDSLVRVSRRVGRWPSASIPSGPVPRGGRLGARFALQIPSAARQPVSGAYNGGRGAGPQPPHLAPPALTGAPPMLAAAVAECTGPARGRLNRRGCALPPHASIPTISGSFHPHS